MFPHVLTPPALLLKESCSGVVMISCTPLYRSCGVVKWIYCREVLMILLSMPKYLHM